MGSSGSKPSNGDALLLSRERVKCISQAIDSRYALSAAHLSYIQSLCSIGSALRQFVEAALLIEPSYSTSKVNKSPSHSFCAPPSPSQFAEHVSSPSQSGSPLSSPRPSNMSYMRATGASAMTVTIDSPATHFVSEDSLTSSLLPPPPLLEIGSSWDYFDPANAVANCELHKGETSGNINFCRRQLKEAEVLPLSEEQVCLEGFDVEVKSINLAHKIDNIRSMHSGSLSVKGSIKTMIKIASSDISGSNMENSDLQREIYAEREDTSEFITHRAKCFLSSMRDIEHRFLRAAEAGTEMSRMLETDKIRLGIYSDRRGKSPSSQITSVFNRIWCKGDPLLKHGVSMQNVRKVITWSRAVSSLSSSSSSRIPLASATKHDEENTESDFTEEFCMISGSHSSTLDRLYAWECKLYDDIKSIEYIRKVYDQKCKQLGHQCARDLDAGLIDKTRAVVKDLHSRLGVAIWSVESISKRIEKLRDDELQPQLVELMQGLIRMWKAMLECHHAQFITITLAYLTKSSTAAALGESYRQALSHLINEMGYFSHTFSNWVSAYKSYVEDLSTWLQKCVLQPQERRKGRRVIFPPHQALSPPIFVLCNGWILGLKSLPCKDLCDSIEEIMSILHDSFEQPTEAEQVGKMADELENSRGFDGKQVRDCGRPSNLDELKTGLTRLFDRLTKFSETSLKVHEDVKQGNEIASIAYANIVV
ncbi:DUF630 DUF632 domains containing protein [Musa troglodytarum]|uniref:DUF630 DUF632 domains containing protein n=1 Tax=Musa troglodytarum TaxID=320322 RepID=A0A9E7EX35_9LILI|nr:DUF630 DUF632 domains containing protein [Musa troglodytarum]URD83389.1 DUF630 DUF632 domains containing protein [Musa troglodytarum]URD83390.1 DUF630 DUF632 domains containing protein [Musa troglodytarum]